MDLKDNHGLKTIPHKNPTKWVSVEKDPGASFLNVTNHFTGYECLASIAEVLAFSHPILEKGYVPEPDLGAT